MINIIYIIGKNNNSSILIAKYYSIVEGDRIVVNSHSLSDLHGLNKLARYYDLEGFVWDDAFLTNESSLPDKLHIINFTIAQMSLDRLVTNDLKEFFRHENLK